MHRPRSLGRQVEPLRLQMVFLHPLRTDRAERARPDQQGQHVHLDAAPPQLLQQFGREVQPGRRCRHRARTVGVNRLVALPVQLRHPGGHPSLPARLEHVWRQGHGTLPHGGLRATVRQPDRPPPPAQLLDQLDAGARLPQGQHLAGAQAAAAAGQRKPSLPRLRVHQQQAHPTARPAARAEPRRNHAGIVHHQHVAGLEQPGQIAEPPVLDAATLPVEHHQAGLCPPLGRHGRHQFRRQVVVEQLSAHHGASRSAKLGRRICHSGGGLSKAPAIAAAPAIE